MTDNTYADRWRDSINETYTDADEHAWEWFSDSITEQRAQPGEVIEITDEEVSAFVGQALAKAARILRGYDESATFTGEELDLIRHLMPAHEVHQSGSVRWLLDKYDVRAVTI